MKYSDFTDILMEHFRNPRFAGELENATHRARVVNDYCGDVMLLTVRVEGDRVEEARFKTYGCTGSIAVSSIVLEKLQGMTLDDARAISDAQISEWAGGLEEPKLHCADLVVETLQQALAPGATS